MISDADRARIRSHAEQLAADAPPLTGARRERVRSLLRGSDTSGPGAGSPGEHDTTPGREPGGRTGPGRSAA